MKIDNGVAATPSPVAAPTAPAAPSVGSLGRAGIGVGGATNTDNFYAPSVAGGTHSTPGYAPTPPSAPAPPAHTSSPFDSDPGYQAALLAEKNGIGSLNGSLQNEIAKRIVAYGDPGLAAMAGFGLDPQSAGFARQNYLSGNSELARIDKSHGLDRQHVVNALAAHGLVFSGDTGYQLGQADQVYGNNVYDAQQRALADILGYRQQTQSQETDLHNQVIQALENAFNNYSANPGAYGQIPEQPTPPPSKATPKTVALPKASAPKAKKKSSNAGALRALSIRSAAMNKLYGL